MTSVTSDQGTQLSLELMSLAEKIPQNRKLVVFVGRNQGLLLDNVKYAFLEAVRGNYSFTPLFVTTLKEEAYKLAAQNLPVSLFPGADIKLSAQAGVVVCDNFDWRLTPLWPLMHRAKTFQLWHGIPLKKIGQSEINSPVNMNPDKAAYLKTLYSNYSSVLSTSQKVTEILQQVFYEPPEAYIEAGFPRNDGLLKKLTAHDFINTDTEVYGLMRQHRKQGGKVLLHMPTFRDSGIGPLTAQNLDPDRIAGFALKHNILWLLKVHPSLRLPKKIYPGLIVCDSTSDVYPLLQEADILLTDYSSVFFDFLLCDRPIHFHAHDMTAYTSESREFLLDFEEWTPGPVSRTENELFMLLEQTLNNEDKFSHKRKDICNCLHYHQDAGSAARVCRHLELMTAS